MVVVWIIFTLAFLFCLYDFSLAQSQPYPCGRWGHSTVVAGNNDNQPNSTLWIQGGQAKTSPSQTQNTWTNCLLSLDLTSDWPTGSAPLKIQDYINAPALSLGALYSNKNGSILYQFAGESSDAPWAPPPTGSCFKYDISAAAWSSVPLDGDSIQRPGEGAASTGLALGTNSEPLALYAFGHQDSSAIFAYLQILYNDFRYILGILRLRFRIKLHEFTWIPSVRPISIIFQTLFHLQ